MEQTEATGKAMSRVIASKIEHDGFAIVPDVIDDGLVSRLAARIDAVRIQDNSENVANNSGTYGLRNLIDVLPETAELICHPRVVQLVSEIIGPHAFMTRSTLFDKTAGANWGVFWHQDLSIAVQNKEEVPGFTAWTRKAGVPCVQPPIDLMRDILAVRIHLDDCDASNGALRVLPGTHRMDRLSTSQVEEQQRSIPEVVCQVPAGGAVLMRPLLLHASSPMERSGSRRVIHLEFANFELPDGLEWNYRIPCEP